MKGYEQKSLNYGVTLGIGNRGENEFSKNLFALNYRYAELILEIIQFICSIRLQFLHIFIDFDFFVRP